jgi:hypothetical protein
MNWLLILIAVGFLFFILFNNYNENVYIESDIDKKKYLIRRGNKDAAYLKESANTLAEINKRIVILIDHLERKYNTDSSKNYFIKKFKQNYNHKILSEAAIDNRYTTYTIDKEDMHICLRTRDRYEKLYDINLLMYVILHELAHLCNYNVNGYPIQGHGEEFKYIFKLLVSEAILIGIYEYEDYKESPQEYCGIVISTTILPS